MIKIIATIIILSLLFGCTEESSPTTTEIEMTTLDVGTKTPYYEVISPTELKLPSDVKLEMVKSHDGEDNGFVLLNANRVAGGFMACGCVGAQTGNCVTENDNPETAFCSGTCADSEGNPQPCQLSGPIIGPPKDPFHIKFSQISPVFKQVN